MQHGPVPVTTDQREVEAAKIKDFQTKHSIALTPEQRAAIAEHVKAISQLKAEHDGMLKMLIHMSGAAKDATLQQAACNWTLSEDGSVLIPMPQNLEPVLR